jgi:uncharacterized protein (TIGR03435 family)
MPQFADLVLQLEGSYGESIKSPVLNATGLTGGYDFVLKFSNKCGGLSTRCARSR